MSTPPPAMPGSYQVLETTGICNLACVHCDRSAVPHPNRDEHAHGGPFLDLDLTRALLEDLGQASARFDTLILFWLGEPLLHPHFPSLYPALLRANARYRIFGKIEVHTNALALSPTIAAAALNEADTPQVWHLTLDAVHRDTYRKVKGRDALREVESNVEHLIARKVALGARWPRLVLQFIVSDLNVDEVETFRARWARVLDRAGLSVVTAAGQVPAGPGDEAVIFLRQLDCPTPEEQGRQNAVFRGAAQAMGLALPPEACPTEPSTAANPTPCSGFWKSPVVHWDGDVTVCTRDSGLAMRLGNLHRQPFSEIWWGPRIEALRARVAAGDYSGLPLCDTCFIPRSANYTGIDAEEITRHAAWAQARGEEARP
ncbi:MAG: SPASM domain-containing protein [Pseudomonadota bacterium]